MQKRGEITLYNVMFPIWFLWLFPLAWLIVLPVNFVIDLLVVAITMKVLGVISIRQTAKSVILRVWGMGFVADLIGTLLMLLSSIVEFPGALGDWWYQNLANAVSFNPFRSVYAVLYVTVCVAVSALCIYWFNLRFCLKKAALDDHQKRRLALALAVFTAPYLFYFPSAWIY